MRLLQACWLPSGDSRGVYYKMLDCRAKRSARSTEDLGYEARVGTELLISEKRERERGVKHALDTSENWLGQAG